MITDYVLIWTSANGAERNKFGVKDRTLDISLVYEFNYLK